MDWHNTTPSSAPAFGTVHNHLSDLLASPYRRCIGLLDYSPTPTGTSPIIHFLDRVQILRTKRCDRFRRSSIVLQSRRSHRRCKFYPGQTLRSADLFHDEDHRPATSEIDGQPERRRIRDEPSPAALSPPQFKNLLRFAVILMKST